MNQELLHAYARLAVMSGVNLQKHQTLLLDVDIEAADFARMVVKEAYEAGAKEVVVSYNDALMSRYHYQYQSDDVLAQVHAWQIDKHLDYLKEGACRMHIISPRPGALKDCDPKKMAIRQKVLGEAGKEVRDYTSASRVPWCILAVPNEEWATMVFPNLSASAAMERLWEEILRCVYVKKGEDPVATWRERDAMFQKRVAQLNEYAFERLHFTNALGTDLVVGLPKGHIWGGGSELDQKQIRFNANLPTEEVFTTPHKDQVNGIVYASRPLLYNGNLIHDFHFTFRDGKVVEYDAKVGRDLLQAMLEMDEGASSLGEVALVSDDSPISQSSLLFYNTIFDENASCHLALGDAYPSCIKNGQNMNEDELKQHGSNVSMIHVDFMFGTADMQVMGETADGRQIEVFQNGKFVL